MVLLYLTLKINNRLQARLFFEYLCMFIPLQLELYVWLA